MLISLIVLTVAAMAFAIVGSNLLREFPTAGLP